MTEKPTNGDGGPDPAALMAEALRNSPAPSGYSRTSRSSRGAP